MITEIVRALGSWGITLSPETPDHVRDALGLFGHIAVVNGPVDVAGTADGLLPGARYVGVLRSRDDLDDGGLRLAGAGMVFWLADEDDKSHLIETELELTSATLADAVAAVVAVCPSVALGTVHPQEDPAARYTGSHRYQSPRKALDVITAAFGAEFRVNGDGTVDVGTAAQLYNTESPDTIIVRRGAGADMDLVALGSEFEVGTSSVDYSTDVLLLGQTLGIGGAPDEVFATGRASLPSVPYFDLFGNPVKLVRVISESSESEASAAVRAQLHMNRFGRVTQAVKLTAQEYESRGNFDVGDSCYVYDPESGIFDPANEVTFRGQVWHPDVVRISGVTWPVVEGMTVAFRTGAGEWVDLTRYVTWETGGNDLTIGDLPRTLRRPADDPVQIRLDAAKASKPDTSIPSAPTGLALTTEATVDANGNTVATITPTWNPVTTNTDASTISDLSHYLVAWRPAFRAVWTGSVVTEDTTIDLVGLVPDLEYRVRVAAVDTAGHTSAWSAVAAIVTEDDDTAPPAPADPVVTHDLGPVLRIEYLGTDVLGAAMPADTTRIDVHVGAPGFAWGPTNRVASLDPRQSQVAYATAAYGVLTAVRLVAYDRAGNASPPSGEVTGTTSQVVSDDVFDGAIGSSKLADLAVITAKIADLAVNDAKIGDLSVGKLTSGVGTFDLVVAGQLMTALTGQRAGLTPLGVQAWNDAEQLTIDLNGVDNLITGLYRTALSGRRIEMGAGGDVGTINLYAPDGTRTRISGFTGISGDEAIAVGVPITGAHGAWVGFQAESDEAVYTLGRSITNMFGGKTTGTDRKFSVEYVGDKLDLSLIRSSRLTITPADFFSLVDTAGSWVAYEHTATGDKARLFIDGGGGNFLYHAAGQVFRIYERQADDTIVSKFAVDADTYWFQWPGVDQRAYFSLPTSLNSSTKLTLINNTNFGGLLKYHYPGGANPQRIEVRDWSDTNPIELWASAFTVVSSQTTKDDVVPFEGDPLALLRPMEAATFLRKRGTDTNGAPMPAGGRELGVIAERAAPELQTLTDDGSVYGVGVGPWLTALTASVLRIDERLTALERRPALP